MEQQPGPDRKAIIAILLCAVVWAVWMQISYTRQQEAARELASRATPVATAGDPMTAGTDGGATAAAGGAPADPVVAGTAGTLARVEDRHPVTEARLSNKVLALELSSKGARPVTADLKEYRAAIDAEKDESLVHLVTSATVEGGKVAPLAPWFGTAEASRFPADARFEEVRADEGEVQYRWTSPEGLQVTRTYRADDDYLVTMMEEISNVGNRPITGRPGAIWATNMKGVKQSWFIPGEQEFTTAAGVADRVQSKNPKEPGEGLIYGGQVDWVGVEDRYFLAAVIPIDPAAVDPETRVVVENPGQDPRFEAKDSVRFFRPGEKALASLALAKETTLEPGESQDYAYRLYLGPKDYNLLKDAGHNLAGSIAWGGPLKPISQALWYALQWFYSWTANWGLAIIVLTIVVRGLVSPLAAKQMKMANEFAAKSAKLKPKLDKLREKHKDDPMTLNKETMLVYKQHGLSPFSPLAGCLPLLIQMPIWFALYRVLWNSIDLRQAPFAFWIQDLAAPDPWKILPVALGAVTFIQMKLTPNTGMDPAQAKMMQYMMPLVFMVPMMGLPAGLVLYIFTSTLMNIGQQWYLRRVIPPVPAATVPAQQEERAS